MFKIKVILFVLSCSVLAVFGSPNAGGTNPGGQCELSDTPCCLGKIIGFLAVVKDVLGDLCIPALEIGPGLGVLQLTQKLENVVIKGLETLVPTDFKFDLKAGKATLVFEVKQIKVSAKYDISGRCLAIPMWGSGDAVITSATIFKQCKIKDQECLKDALQDALPKLRDGLPDWGVPALDPILIPEMTIGAGQNVVQLTQKYKNANLIGVSDSKIESVNIDLDKKKIDVKFTFPLWILNATYEVSGKVLLLPVAGHGPCSLTLENGRGILTFDTETYKKKDQTHIKGTVGKLDAQIQKATYQFDNLFNGDKALGDNINMVLNENWKDVYEEVGPGYGEVYAATFMNIMNRIFTKVPVSELFLS